MFIAIGSSVLSLEEAMKKGARHPSGNGRVLVTVPYRWSDHRMVVMAMVIAKDGEIIEAKSGFGDWEPDPRETNDSWDLTSTGEYEYLDNLAVEAECRVGYSPMWTDVEAFLHTSFKCGQNPLSHLRRQFRGEWSYYKSSLPLSMMKDGEDQLIFREYHAKENKKGWMVLYTPQARDREWYGYQDSDPIKNLIC